MLRTPIAPVLVAFLGISLGIVQAQEQRPNRPRRPDDAGGAEQGPGREGPGRPGPGGFGPGGFGPGGFGPGGFGPGGPGRGEGGPRGGFGGPPGGFGGPPGGFGGPPGGFGGPMRMPPFLRPLPEADLVSLVAMPEVQKELGLSAEQVQKSQAIVEKLQGDMRSTMEGFDVRETFELEPEERDKKFAVLRSKQETVGQGAFQDLNKLLEPPQWSRLSELDLQRAGAGALRRPPVAERLKITGEQREKLEGILDQAPPFLPPEVRREIDEQALAVLNDSQKDELKKLQGKSFEFPVAQFGGFPGGPGFGGPGFGGPGGPGGPGFGPGGPGGPGFGGPGGPGLAHPGEANASCWPSLISTRMAG